MSITASPTLTLPDEALTFQFIRAAGPGGQNVNKVATAVQLRFDTACLPGHIRARALKIAGKRATKEGVIVIEAKRYRTQERNREDAIARLVTLVQRAETPPAPPRRKKRVSRAAKRKRVQAKRRKGAKKQLRKPPREE